MAQPAQPPPFSLLAEVCAVKAVSLVGLGPQMLQDGDAFCLQAEGYLVTLTWNAARATWSTNSHPIGRDVEHGPVPAPPPSLKLLDIDPMLLVMRVGPGAPQNQVFQLGVHTQAPQALQRQDTPETGPHSATNHPAPSADAASSETATRSSTPAAQPTNSFHGSVAQSDHMLATSASQDLPDMFSFSQPGQAASHQHFIDNPFNQLTATTRQAERPSFVSAPIAPIQPPPNLLRPPDQNAMPPGAYALMPRSVDRSSARGRSSAPINPLAPRPTFLEQLLAASMSAVDPAAPSTEPVLALRVICNGTVLPICDAWPAPSSDAAAGGGGAGTLPDTAASSGTTPNAPHRRPQAWKFTVDFQSIAVAAATLARPTHIAAEVQLWAGGKQVDVGYVMLLLTPLNTWFSWAPVQPATLRGGASPAAPASAALAAAAMAAGVVPTPQPRTHPVSAPLGPQPLYPEIRPSGSPAVTSPLPAVVRAPAAAAAAAAQAAGVAQAGVEFSNTTDDELDSSDSGARGATRAAAPVAAADPAAAAATGQPVPPP